MSDQLAAAVVPEVDEPKKKRQRKTDKKPRRQPRYSVILWDSDDHTYAYVIGMLTELFHYPVEKGFQIASEVDNSGKAAVLTTTREHAELKRDQIHAYGKGEMASSKGSMYATIEPMPGE